MVNRSIIHIQHILCVLYYYRLNSKNNELQLTVKQAPLQQVEERGIATAVANTEGRYIIL